MRPLFLLTLLVLTLSATARADSDPNLLDHIFQLPEKMTTAWSNPESEPAAAPFTEGAWTFQTYGSATFGDSDHNDIYTAHAGVGYFFQDDLSINLEALAGKVDSVVDDDGFVGGLDLLFRWHFKKGDTWTLYLDGGAGFQEATTNFPSDSHHNFRPQIGIGGTWQLKDNLNLITGIRWLHISNANTTNGNDGLNAAQVYAGLMWGF